MGLRFLLSCVVFGSLFIQSVSGQSWYFSPVFHGRSIYSISIFDRVNIVAAGGNEQNDSLQDIFRSYSGGMTWDFSSNQGGGYIRSVDFSDTQNGMAVGYAGKLLKTVDGGVSWSQVFGPSPVNQRNFTTVLYKDAQTLFAFGGRNYGDDTIQTIIKSIDGGSNWTVLRDQPGQWIKGVYFINSLTGFAVGSKGSILKTTDGGSNWTAVNSPLTTSDFNAVYFNSATTGYIAGGNFVLFDTLSSVRTLLKTIDGGANWSVVMNEPGGCLMALDFIDQNKGYFVGDGAAFYKTTNGGNNWIRETITIDYPYATFLSVKFLNENFGIIGGNGGIVFLYSDETLPDVITGLPYVSQVTDTSASVSFRGTINTHNSPVVYNLRYATNAAFTENNGVGYDPFYPQTFNSNTAAPVQVNTYGLLPDTTYYYFLTATSASGTVNGDTLTFVTKLPYSVFAATPPAVNGTDVVLSGEASGFDVPVSLLFQFVNGPGGNVAAIPATISDNLQHIVSSAPLQLTQGTHSFRLRGIMGADTIYSNTIDFFVGDEYQELQTSVATAITNDGATFNGFLSGFAVGAEISFEYGPDISFGFETPAQPATISDQMDHHPTAQLTGLPVNTPCYFRIKAETPFSTWYGETLHFITGFENAVFTTGPATQVTSTSARLTGRINQLPLSVNLEFEYGLTPLLGNTVTATPSTVNDPSDHTVYTTLNGLLPDTIYYYRLKGDFTNFDLDGGMHQVFTAAPEIPDWDFQNWQTNTTELPEVWALPGDNFEKVPGVSGNALHLRDKSIALLGMIGSSTQNNPMGTFNGCPFGIRPDSINFKLNYAVDPSDTALVLVVTTRQAAMLSMDFMMLTGNSNNSFESFSIPLNYFTSDIPDSIILIFSSFMFIEENPARNSIGNSVIIDDIGFYPPADIGCNTDFDDWFTYDHLDLGEWFYNKYVDIDPQDAEGSAFVLPYEYGLPGEFAAELRSKQVGTGFLGALVSSADYTINDHISGPSFPVSRRFAYLNGYYRFLQAAQDTAEIQVALFSEGEQIGSGRLEQSQTINDLTPFDIRISYINDSIIPDSATVCFSPYTNNARGASQLFIDKVSFDGFWGSDGAIIVGENEMRMKDARIYPNPAYDRVIIEPAVPASTTAILQVMDMNGRVTDDIPVSSGQSSIVLNLSHYNAGVYQIRYFSKEASFTKKLVIIK